MSKRLAPKPEITARTKSTDQVRSLEAFDRIDGRHPWQNAVKEGYVNYRVRKLNKGKVLFFNFALAREMGLISATHGDELTPALQQKIIDTFSIQILNEYDLAQGIRYPLNTLKPYEHMATRYLQLQHANKQGRTSGDGRSVWNGHFRNKGVTWDVSSRGTGVTCLSPGAVQAGEPLKTGTTDFGYGCGQADVTELLGSAVLSEIFHLNGITTERVLTVIDLGKGCGIGVRAAPNLIRPAHLFLYLKQGRLEPLKRATDYLISRQVENGQWNFSHLTPDRYRKMLKEVSKSFARFAAKLERDYIFAWMDWDGDNVLATAGIIDYGSIRQFGLRHDQYRYDDVDRFSTNLNEQRGKARLTVQVFAQMIHFIESGARKPLEAFANSNAVRDFDREFDHHVRELFLAQVGFNDKQVSALMSTRKAQVEDLYSKFLVLEKTKTKSGEKRLPDGVNRPAVFNMRAVLRELPQMITRANRGIDAKAFKTEELLDVMTTNFAKRADLKLKGQLRKHIESFSNSYLKTLTLVCGDQNPTQFMKTLSRRAENKNRAARITGNGAEFVIDAILKAKRRGVSTAELHAAIELFVMSQVGEAESSPSATFRRPTKPQSLQSNAGRLYQELMNIATEHEEDI